MSIPCGISLKLKFQIWRSLDSLEELWGGCSEWGGNWRDRIGWDFSFFLCVDLYGGRQL